MTGLTLNKLISLITAINLLSALPLFAENIDIDKTMTRLPLGKKLHYYEDKTGNLTLEEIRKNDINKWTASHEDNLGFGFTKSAFWIRCTLHNTDKIPKDVYLQQSYPLIDNINLYFPSPAEYEKIEAGDTKPFHERPYNHRTFIFPLKISPGSHLTLYLRYKSDSSMNIDLSIWSPEHFVSSMISDTMFNWTFYGIMIIMFIYNLFIFLSVRDISYIYYILYIAAFTMLIMSINGTSFMLLWPDSTWWANNSLPFFIGIVNFAILQFARYFMRTWDRTLPTVKYADNTLITLTIIAIILSVSTLLINNYRISIIATTVLTGVDVSIGTLIAVIYLFIPGFWVRPVKFFLSAFFLFLGGIMLFVLKTYAILPEVFITTYGIQIGAVFNVALLSFALADNINMMKNKLHSANLELKDLNENLEKKVKQRTEELEAASEELEAMNDSLITINDQLVEAQRIAGLDMRMAVNVQRALLPKTSPKTKQWDTAFFYKPMSGVSGDFLDFYLENDLLTGILLIDVSGHGISSGLVTMIARSVFFRNIMKRSGTALNKILEESNMDLINEMGTTEKYITGVILHFQENKVEYVNAAHTDLLCRKNNSRSTNKIDLGQNDFKGMFLGMPETAGAYEQITFEVEKGDVLLLYTDGLTESKNHTGEEYEIAKLISSLNSAPDSSAQHILDHLINDFKKFIDDTPSTDDISVIVLKRLV